MSVDNWFTSRYVFIWALGHWWVFAILMAVAGALGVLSGERFYKEISGKLYVKHARWGKWVEVEQHLRDSHD